jgi:hypothetical protein
MAGRKKYKPKRSLKRASQRSGFESEEQRKAVMAMLRGRVVAWHGTRSRALAASKKFKRDHPQALHVGTLKAAKHRLYDMSDAMGGHLNKRTFIQVSFPVKKPLLIKNKSRKVYRRKKVKSKRAANYGWVTQRQPTSGMPRFFNEKSDFDFDRLEDVSRNPKLLARLRRRGYDVIPYINSSEDPGSISYLILDPSQVTILQATKQYLERASPRLRRAQKKKEVTTRSSRSRMVTPRRRT